MSLYSDILVDRIMDNFNKKLATLEAEKERLESLMGNENSAEFTPLRLAFEKAHEESCAYSNLHSVPDKRTAAVWAECYRLRAVAERAQGAFNNAWMGDEAYTYLPQIEREIDELEAERDNTVFDIESSYY